MRCVLWLRSEDVLQCLVSTFQSKPVEGLAGVISVRTESWNSKDGMVVRSHKAQAIGGLTHVLIWYLLLYTPLGGLKHVLIWYLLIYTKHRYYEVSDTSSYDTNAQDTGARRSQTRPHMIVVIIHNAQALGGLRHVAYSYDTCQYFLHSF